MSMRDKIAEIVSDAECSDDRGCGSSVIDPDGIADAIIAALPDMVPDLVWEKLSERHYRHMVNNKLSWRCESYANGDWYLTYSVPGYCDTLIEGKWNTLDAAKAEANAHNRATIMSALGVTV